TDQQGCAVLSPTLLYGQRNLLKPCSMRTPDRVTGPRGRAPWWRSRRLGFRRTDFPSVRTGPDGWKIRPAKRIPRAGIGTSDPGKGSFVSLSQQPARSHRTQSRGSTFCPPTLIDALHHDGIFQPDLRQEIANPLLRQLFQVERSGRAAENDRFRNQFDGQVAYAPAGAGQDVTFQLGLQMRRVHVFPNSAVTVWSWHMAYPVQRCHNKPQRLVRGHLPLLTHPCDCCESL